MIETILALWIYATIAHIRCFMLSDRIRDLSNRINRIEHPTCERTDDLGDC